MNKKSILYLLFAIVFLFSFAGSLMVFADDYLKQIATKNNFQNKMKSGMNFVFLEHMNEDEIEKCNELYDILKNKNDKAIYPLPMFAKDIKSLHKKLESKCELKAFKELFSNDLIGNFYLYNIKDFGILVLYKDSNDFRVAKFFNEENCSFDKDFDDKKILASDETIVANIENKHYLISEWFGNNKYVFYYLDKSAQYNELVCRFNALD